MPRVGLSGEALQRALDRCASEPIHTPGLVQAHGAAIAVNPETRLIDYASDNAAALLGMGGDGTLPGRSLDTLFDAEVLHRINNQFAPSGGNSGCFGEIRANGELLGVSSADAGVHTIFEFERLDTGAPSDRSTLATVAMLTERIMRTRSLTDLTTVSTRLLRQLLGYDRVMVYQFDPRHNGIVVAEETTAGLSPYLGLRFPNWDIPAQARAIMTRIPYRYIADVNAAPVALRKAHAGLPDLDMTHASLRGVSELHLQYLRNMGTRATLTLHVTNGDSLWGIISCHHETPRRPAPHLREICTQFTRVFGVKVAELQSEARLERFRRVEALRRDISTRVGRGTVRKVFEQQLLAELSTALQADGAAVALRGNLVQHGTAPDDEGLRQVLAAAPRDGIFVSSDLQRDAPELAALCGPEIAGLLLAPLPEDAMFLFFRKAQDQETSWAGAPEKAIEWVDGEAHISPRGSFETYRSIVTGTSRPWTEDDLRLAEDLWALLVTSERRVLIEKTNRQQAILIQELNHRVRNILALIRSLSQQTMAHNGTISSYVAALEARIAAVASAHDLAAEEPANNVTLCQIIRGEAAPFNAQATRVTTEGQDMGLKDDLTPVFALVIHELMTNAAKYGALSRPGGSIRISLATEGDDGLVLNWVETGGPAPGPQPGSGFGTYLIDNAVPYELGGSITREFAETGLRLRLCLPPDILIERTRIETGAGPTHAESVGASPRTAGLCLLLEDNFVVSLDTERVLRDMGFAQVCTASNCADALDVLTRETPSFAVLDINLGGDQTSGPVAKVLMERSIPFIFVSGYSETSKIGEAFDGIAILRKPLRREIAAQALAAV